MAALTVADSLFAPFTLRGCLCRINGFGVTSRILVYAGCTMANPLPPAVHRNTNVKFEVTHFERCRVPMPHQIADQPTILVNSFSPFAVRHASGLYNGLI